ncbi:MAG: hypothetical protein PHX21_05835 [bacterium]|nr:hypothetical protein [bacterium]
MWCLPSIERLNNEAIARRKSEKKKTAKQILRGKVCEFCGTRKATTFVDYFDVFSNVPKGKIFICKKCDEEGKIHDNDDSYFYCDSCNRWMITNYTWERYDTWDEENGHLCLNCALKRAIANPGNWLKKEDIEKLTVEQIQRCKHLIPVEGTYYKQELEYINNVELDNFCGGRLIDSSTCGTPNSGLQEIKKICLETLKEHDEVMLLIDGAYQFSKSIGIYVRKQSPIKNKTSGLCLAGAKEENGI